MSDVKIRIGTRGSKLALWQANHVQAELLEKGISSEIIIIKTKGDKIQNLSFDKLEGKGFFTKEIEDALLEKSIDVAVHSLKDLPTEMDPALTIAGLSYRESPKDCLIIPKSKVSDNILSIDPKAIIGTSSIRRKRMLQALLPDISFKDIRGNVPTRVKKLDEQGLDAIVLAEAGLNRLKLDLSNYKKVSLHHSEVVPAAGQGVIAYQTRAEDLASRKIIGKIHHKEVASCTNVERKVLNKMDGGCQVPLGVHCEFKNDNYHSYAGYYDGEKMINVRHSQSTHVGLADKLLQLIDQKSKEN